MRNIIKTSALALSVAGFSSAAHASSVSFDGDWRLLDRQGQEEAYIDVASLAQPGRVRVVRFAKVPLEAVINTYAVDCRQKTYQAVEIWMLVNQGTQAQNLGAIGEPTYGFAEVSNPRHIKMIAAVCKGVTPPGPGAGNAVQPYLDWKRRNP